MPKKITEKQKNIIIKSLASGASHNAAAKQAGVCRQTVDKDLSLLTKSSNIKKEVQEQIKNELVQDNKDIIEGLYRIQRDAIKGLTAEKINSQSGAAIATTLAIACDKAQLLTGGATENINLNTGDKHKMLDFLGKKLKESKSAKMSDNSTIKEGKIDLPSENGKK